MVPMMAALSGCSKIWKVACRADQASWKRSILRPRVDRQTAQALHAVVMDVEVGETGWDTLGKEQSAFFDDHQEQQAIDKT